MNFFTRRRLPLFVDENCFEICHESWNRKQAFFEKHAERERQHSETVKNNLLHSLAWRVMNTCQSDGSLQAPSNEFIAKGKKEGKTEGREERREKKRWYRKSTRLRKFLAHRVFQALVMYFCLWLLVVVAWNNLRDSRDVTDLNIGTHHEFFVAITFSIAMHSCWYIGLSDLIWSDLLWSGLIRSDLISSDLICKFHTKKIIYVLENHRS